MCVHDLWERFDPKQLVMGLPKLSIPFALILVKALLETSGWNPLILCFSGA